MVDFDKVLIKTPHSQRKPHLFSLFSQLPSTPLCGQSASDRMQPLPADNKFFKSRVPAFYKCWRVIFRHFCSSFIQHQFYI